MTDQPAPDPATVEAAIERINEELTRCRNCEATALSGSHPVEGGGLSLADVELLQNALRAEQRESQLCRDRCDWWANECEELRKEWRAAVRAGREAERTLAEIDQLRSVAKLEVIGGPEHTECHVIAWFSRPAGLYGAKEAVGATFTAALRALGAMLAKTESTEADDGR